MAKPESSTTEAATSPVNAPEAESAKTDRTVCHDRVHGLRGGLALLVLITLMLWPAWSLYDMHKYLKAAQPKPADARAGWTALARRFAPVRQALAPGTVLAYQRSEWTWVAPSRIHDVHFVCIPLVVTEWRYKDSDLVLADMVNDDELRAYVKKHGFAVEHHLGSGLAVLRRPAEPTP